eukprot:568811-Rhodomonas_salina.1
MPYASWVTRSSGKIKRVCFKCRCRGCVQHWGLSGRGAACGAEWKGDSLRQRAVFGLVPPLPVVIPPVVPQSRRLHHPLPPPTLVT